jgi:hypothetical protein
MLKFVCELNRFKHYWTNKSTIVYNAVSFIFSIRRQLEDLRE